MLRSPLFISVATTIVLLAASPASARDCGMPPADPPFIPNGSTANDDDIRVAVREVQDYGFDIQSFLNCQELNREHFFLNMNENQRERWTEDYNAMADALTEIEVALNEQIRIFNSR